jgi:hypothetical protein
MIKDNMKEMEENPYHCHFIKKEEKIQLHNRAFANFPESIHQIIS